MTNPDPIVLADRTVLVKGRVQMARRFITNLGILEHIWIFGNYNNVTVDIGQHAEGAAGTVSYDFEADAAPAIADTD